ncbi:MAG: response regulator transcription factor [Calditrichaeota bacterium]|nr:response regulator transcription factor [Calditrichota bacterium]
MKTKILLVEDEQKIGQIIQFNLEEEGYEVNWILDGNSVIRAYSEQRYDLIILDVMLPGINGFDLFESIRLKDNDVAILFLTARNDQKDKILGLKLGADDYITKPFDLNEFLLRVKNILARRRREIGIRPRDYRFGPNSYDSRTMTASNGREEIQLSQKEGRLLQLLIEHKNEVVSRDSILEKVWGYDIYPSTRTIDNFIVKLRKFFEENQKEPKYIQSVRGIGYKLTDQV